LQDNPHRLRIRTIDSVCAEIARSLPVLSGSGGQLAPVLDANPLHREAARRTLQLLGGPDPVLDAALRNLLLHRDGNLAECETLLAQMLALRDQWGELIPLTGSALTDAALDATILPKLEAALDRAICTGLNRLAQSIPTDVLADLTQLAATLGHADGYNGAPSPIALCAGIHTAPEATAKHLNHWRALIHLLVTASTTWRKEKGINKKTIGFDYDRKHSHHATLCSILDQLSNREDADSLLEAFRAARALPPAKYPREQWEVARALFRVLRHALVELKFVFAERNQCDFTELGLLARTALGTDDGADDLAAALGMKLQHLLVDEMQDTSTSQYELIERLTRGWDGHSQTVFLVGDPKQSIYLFRQARVERFVRTMRTGLLGDLPLTTLRLTANFRSQRTLVEQVNADFSLLFPSAVAPDHPEDVPFAAAAPTRAAVLETESRRWHTHPLHDATQAPSQRLADAQTIRTIIQHWRTRKPDCTIAVLVRSRSHLAEIVAALKAPTKSSPPEQDPGCPILRSLTAKGGIDNPSAPIPYRAVEIEPLADRLEVLDLFALTRALLHPADRIAWLAILRAPWCGLTLTDLHLLTGTDDEAHKKTTISDLFQQRGDLLSADGCQRLERLWLVMDAAAKQRARLTTAQWVERTWRALGGNLWLDAEATANALRYLELLDEIEKDTATGTMNIAVLESALKRLYAKPAEHPHAVDLITIHGSKGLEWDVVIVPALERRGQSSRSRLLNWVELDSADHDSAPILLAPIAGRGEDSSELNAWLRSIENAREAAERKRLVYVACTRAREELHLFAAPTTKTDGTLSINPDSLLRAAWPAAEPHFAASPQSQLSQSNLAHQLQTSVLGLSSRSKAEGSASLPPTQNSVISTEAQRSGETPAFFSIGAAAATTPKPQLHRLPTEALRNHFAQFKPLPIPTEDPGPIAAQSFTRPEGGFAARAFGNAVHAFLELLAQRIATGETPTTLTAALPQWLPRIAAILRADGLPPAMVERLAQKVQIALQNILADPTGQWLLAAHPDAASERALTAYQPRRTSIRLDRIFKAAATPLATGDTHLWIIDFKTTTHGSTGLEAFLQKERETYTPQMNTYAQVLSTGSPATPIRVMLYYPMLPAHTWWEPAFPAT
ncbi:MAG: UvrD-helicase domain-containing protein, partial [Granulicella sp.]